MFGAIWGGFQEILAHPCENACQIFVPFNPLQTFFMVLYTVWGMIRKRKSAFIQYEKYI
uniref:Uncharacterized protein n=1 Tax=Anguilla anguilla TaxID=7936 RepID=A0A0E9XD09_ANGAN